MNTERQVLLDQLVFRKYEPGDQRQVSALVRRRVGYPSFRSAWCIGEDRAAMVATVNKNIVGFVLAVNSSEEDKSAMASRIPSVRRSLARAMRVLYIDTIAVDESMRGLGVGSRLMSEVLRVTDADFGCLDAWNSVLRGIHLDRAARAIGFRPMGVKGRVWAAESVSWDHLCPGCHRCPCRCTAVTYVWQRKTNCKPLPVSAGKFLRRLRKRRGRAPLRP